VPVGSAIQARVLECSSSGNGMLVTAARVPVVRPRLAGRCLRVFRLGKGGKLRNANGGGHGNGAGVAEVWVAVPEQRRQSRFLGLDLERPAPGLPRWRYGSATGGGNPAPGSAALVPLVGMSTLRSVAALQCQPDRRWPIRRQ